MKPVIPGAVRLRESLAPRARVPACSGMKKYLVS
jgi:hypothetical protein